MITVVGGGFAGVEAAWAAARRGVPVRLYEMRPGQCTPAHKTGLLSELVCSNSLKSKDPSSPAGLLKQEMVALESLVIPTAEANSVPGGQSLAVDRNAYAEEITRMVEAEPGIEVVRREFVPEDLDEHRALGPVVIATGPLSAPAISDWIAAQTGKEHLYFYDAVSPTVDASTIDRDMVFAQSRYNKGGDDYLNCPFDRESYEAFVDELLSAEQAPLRDFEAKYFEGCLPIEEIAARGRDSLAFGNFKPVGLEDPRTGKRPYAVVQLRAENHEASLYSIVACQTRMKWGEQTRVLRMIPGLEKAEFVRLGVMHRNTYLNAPSSLTDRLELRASPGVYVAGQLTGVEGYVESAAIGLLAGINATSAARGKMAPLPPRETAYGSLLAHLTDETPREFAPMNINWGLLPTPPDAPRNKGERRARQIEAARKAFERWKEELGARTSVV